MCTLTFITADTGKMFCWALVFAYASFCTAQDEYDVRLSGSTTPGQGNVEVFYNGAWGTVCRDSDWGFHDAFVVCRQLGYSWVNGSSWEDRVGTGSGSVVLGGVQCTGSEASLDLCSNSGWGQQECSDDVDTAAVSCGSMDGYANATAVLADGLRPSIHHVVTEGNAHLRLNTQEDYVYVIQDHNWNLVNANVFCRMLNATAAIKARHSSYFGRHEDLVELHYFRLFYVKVLQLEFDCLGSERSLADCPARYLEDVGNQPGHDAGVECLRREEPDDFRVRLVGGNTPLDGNIEVFHNGGWGSISDGYPLVVNERSIADVVCRQLGQGYPTAWTHMLNRNTESQLKMALSTCSGAESSLAQCVGVHWIDTVGVGYQVNVTCSGPVSRDELKVRLNDFKRSPIDYNGSGHGYLEVFDGERFGTVCDEDWTEENANVVCKQLGYGPANPYGLKYYEGVFRLTRGPIFLSKFSCKGTEKSLKACSHGDWLEHECGHSMDVGVSCEAVTKSGASVAVTSFVAVIFMVAISSVEAV